MSILNYIWPATYMLVVCVPSSIVNKLYLWQLFTGFYMNYNLVDLVFAVFSYLYTAYALEHEMGTVRLI